MLVLMAPGAKRFQILLEGIELVSILVMDEDCRNNFALREVPFAKRLLGQLHAPHPSPEIAVEILPAGTLIPCGIVSTDLLLQIRLTILTAPLRFADHIFTSPSARPLPGAGTLRRDRHEFYLFF